MDSLIPYTGQMEKIVRETFKVLNKNFTKRNSTFSNGRVSVQASASAEDN